MEKAFRVVLSDSRGGLRVAATDEWTLLEDTIREYTELDSNDDQSLGEVGRLLVRSAGFVAFAFKEINGG